MKVDILKRGILSGGCLVFETKTHSFKSQWHSHPEYELVFIKSGKGELQYGATKIAFNQNDLFLFGPWIPHEFIDVSLDHHSISCIFHEELLSISSYQCQISQSISQLLKSAHNGIKFEVDNHSRPRVDSFFKTVLQQKGILQAIELLLFIYKTIELNTNNVSIANIANPSESIFIERNAKFQNILKYINDNLSNNISIQDIANAFFISRSTLARLFTDILQTNITHYITQQRLSHACQLLSTTNIPITEIGGRVGFQSISSFNRAFARYKSLSPRDYRQQYKLSS